MNWLFTQITLNINVPQNISLSPQKQAQTRKKILQNLSKPLQVSRYKECLTPETYSLWVTIK